MDAVHGKTFPSRSLKISYSSIEGSTRIDRSTVRTLELVQNRENTKSTHCLFGLLNKTLTPMGARYLRTSILQPSIDREIIEARLDAVEELQFDKTMLHATREGLSW